MSELLSKDAIKRASDIETADVPVPEWNGTVRIRGLTGEQRDDYEATLMEESKRGVGLKATRRSLRNARARLVVMAAVKADGSPMFDEDDIPMLAGKSARALDRVAAKARELSGLTEEDEEELLGNSRAAPSGGSGSTLPSPSED